MRPAKSNEVTRAIIGTLPQQSTLAGLAVVADGGPCVFGGMKMSRWKYCCYEDLPESPGVYAIYVLKELVYIGSTKNLRRRLQSHININLKLSFTNTSVWRESVQFKVSLSRSLGDWLQREFRLVCRLKPELNKRDKDFQ